MNNLSHRKVVAVVYHCLTAGRGGSCSVFERVDKSTASLGFHAWENLFYFLTSCPLCSVTLTKILINIDIHIHSTKRKDIESDWIALLE